MKTSNLVSNQWLTDTHQTTVYIGILGSGGGLVLFSHKFGGDQIKSYQKKETGCLAFLIVMSA